MPKINSLIRILAYKTSNKVGSKGICRTIYRHQEINVRIRWLDSNIKLVNVLKDNKTMTSFSLRKITTN